MKRASQGQTEKIIIPNKRTSSLSSTQSPFDFAIPKHFSDVVLVVEGTKFYVHKSTLSMWSPVFEKMFTSNFKESTAKEIPLPGKKKDEIETLLQVIYSNGVEKKVTQNNYPFLLKLADEYQMERVKELCIDHLKSIINQSNSLKIYKNVEQFHLKDVMSKCIKEASKRSSNSLEKCKDFTCLRLEAKFEICMKRLKSLEYSRSKPVIAPARISFSDSSSSEIEGE